MILKCVCVCVGFFVSSGRVPFVSGEVPASQTGVPEELQLVLGWRSDDWTIAHPDGSSVSSSRTKCCNQLSFTVSPTENRIFLGLYQSNYVSFNSYMEISGNIVLFLLVR